MVKFFLIMDYAQNCAVIIPKEIQYMHWVIIQATLFVVVLTQHAIPDEDSIAHTDDYPHLVDDHHIFISDDRQHDAHMVET